MIPRRIITTAVTALIVLDCLLLLYIFLVGGVELRIGGVVPGIGKAKLTCNKLSNPFLVLLSLLLLKALVARPRPLRRLALFLARNRRALLLSLAVTAAAAVPRLWNLTGHSLASDELLWVNQGKELVSHLRLREFRKATEPLGHPGIVPSAIIGASYLYLGRDTSSFSRNLLDPVTAARLPVALAGIATCILLYAAGRLVLGDTTAFSAASLLALSPAHIASSRVAQLDSTLALFFTLSLLGWLVAEQRGRMGWTIASAVSFGLALLTKTPAALIPVILFAWKCLDRLACPGRKPRLLDPGDLGWLGIGLGVYFCLFTKLWSEPASLPWIRGLRAIPAGPAVIGFVGALGSLPWLQASAVLLAVRGIALATGGRRAGAALRIPRAALLALAVLSFLQIFRTPVVNTLLHFASVYTFGQAGHLKYWMGRVVIRPPHWFYLFMLLVRTPPVVLALLAWGIARSVASVFRRDDRAGACLLSLLAPLIFIAAMSMGSKMGIRYLDPALPFLSMLAAEGLMGAFSALASLPGAGRGRAARAAQGLAAAAVAASLLSPLAAIAPAYDIYFNFIPGGPAGAARFLSVGSGVGTKEAAEYLKAHARPGEAVFTIGVSGEVRYYLEHMAPDLARGLRLNTARPPDVDWLVVPLWFRVRYTETDRLLSTYRFRRVHSVEKCGVDFLDIYRLEREETPPVSRPSELTENTPYAIMLDKERVTIR